MQGRLCGCCMALCGEQDKPFSLPYISFRQPPKDKYFSIAVSWRQKGEKTGGADVDANFVRYNLALSCPNSKKTKWQKKEVMDDCEERRLSMSWGSHHAGSPNFPCWKTMPLRQQLLRQLGKLWAAWWWPFSCSWNDILFQPLYIWRCTQAAVIFTIIQHMRQVILFLRFLQRTGTG